MKIRTRPDAIAKLMSDLVAVLPNATKLFVEIIEADQADRPEILKKINKVESEADEQLSALLTKIEDTFITPFDREDLLSIAELYDDAIDGLDHAADLLVRFELKELPPAFSACAKDLDEMAEHTVVAASIIKKPKKFRKHWDAVSEIENRLDTRYNENVAELLDGQRDVFEALKMKHLAEAMERVANMIDRFVVSIARTAIKET